MGIFDEKSKALRSEMLLKDESSSCAWLAELLILPLEQQIPSFVSCLPAFLHVYVHKPLLTLGLQCILENQTSCSVHTR